MSRNTLLAVLCFAGGAWFTSQTTLADPGQSPAPAKQAEARQKFMQRFDKNGNGIIDPDEREAAKEAMQKRRGPGGEKGPGDRAVPDPERRQKMLEKFDTDGDGKLSKTERAAAKEARSRQAP